MDSDHYFSRAMRRARNFAAPPLRNRAQELMMDSVDVHCPPNTSIRDHFEALTKELKEPKLAINTADVHYPDDDDSEADKEDVALTVSTLECLICRNVPIEPRECCHCAVVFCLDCINTHRTESIGRNRRKCPHCSKEIEYKRLNKHLLKRLRKIQIRHSCMDKEDDEASSESCEKGQSDPEMPAFDSDVKEPKIRVIKRRKMDKNQNKKLSAFEAFKKTEKYQAILKAMGKGGETQPQTQETKATPKKVLDEKTRDLKRLKAYPYEKYVHHMLFQRCHRHKIFKCPLKCGDQLMNLAELKSHLKKDCQSIELKCTRCGEKTIRGKFKRHTAKKCATILKKKQNQLNERKRDFKSTRKTILAQLAKVANPEHREGDDAYETIEQHSNVMTAGGLWGDTRRQNLDEAWRREIETARLDFGSRYDRHMRLLQQQIGPFDASDSDDSGDDDADLQQAQNEIARAFNEPSDGPSDDSSSEELEVRSDNDPQNRQEAADGLNPAQARSNSADSDDFFAS